MVDFDESGVESCDLAVDNHNADVNYKRINGPFLTLIMNSKTMSTAGYSGTPLIKKLGIKEDVKIIIMNAPGGADAYWKLIGKNCSAQLCSSKEIPSFIHLFTKSQKEFLQLFSKIQHRLHGNVSVWVSWYKKSSGIATDMNEDFIRNFALQNNLVDVKVCAVTNEWSGLKLVIPVAKR